MRACRSRPWRTQFRRPDRRFKPGDAGWPESALQRRLHRRHRPPTSGQKTVKADDREFTASGDANDLDGIRQFAVATCATSKTWTSRPSRCASTITTWRAACCSSGRVAGAVQRLIDSGQDLRGRRRAVAAQHRLRRRQGPRHAQVQDGTFTYFVPDVAYHLHKHERGFTRPSTSRAPTTTAPSPACVLACRLPTWASPGLPRLRAAGTPWCA